TSRNTHKRGVSPSTSTVRSTPLTLIVVAILASVAVTRLKPILSPLTFPITADSPAGNAQLACRRSGGDAGRGVYSTKRIKVKGCHQPGRRRHGRRNSERA